MLAERDASPSDLVALLRPACFRAHALPEDICELAHLLAEHLAPAPPRPGDGRLGI